MSFAENSAIFCKKKRGVNATYSFKVRQNHHGINAKTHAIGRESMHLVFREYKIFADFE